MQRKGANISLKGYDDIFSTEQSRAESQQERVQEIPLSELHPFEGHPFRVVDDEEMMKTAESVRDFGVLTPAIVRPDPDGGYEIVSGHRRHRASELAGKETMPAIVRDLDDDAAIILMVDANLQRETILPSERAFAYKMKLDAMKHQGERTDLTSCQVGTKLRADEKMAEDAGESARTIQRYIRLTELIPELLDMVDTGQIKFNPAVELGELMERKRIQDGAKEYQGHTYMDLARFDEATRHMIIFDVLTDESPVGWKGERNRLYLSDVGYQKALDNQKAGNIKIISHANVAKGNLYYDHRDMAR